MRIDLAPSSLDLSAYINEEKEQIIIVVDILRASTTITTAINNGAKEMIIVKRLTEAREYAKNGYLVGAERKALRCDFARFGNSPFEYKSEIVRNNTVVFTTTNGTKCIERAFEAGGRHIYIGALINLEQAAQKLMQENKDIIVLAAGWNDTFGLEDGIYAGAIADKLISKGAEVTLGDGTRAMYELWKAYGSSEESLLQIISKTEHYARMVNAGVVSDVPYCLMQNDSMPFLQVIKENGKYICRL